MQKRLIVFFLVFAVILSMSLFVFADEPTTSGGGGSSGNWTQGNWTNSTVNQTNTSNGSASSSGGSGEGAINNTNGSGTPRDENQGPIYEEAITCLFKKTSTKQKCFIASESGIYGCGGIEKCQVRVAGYYSTLTWKSSCGGYQYTKTDGKDEVIEFVCNITSNETIKETETIKEKPPISSGSEKSKSSLTCENSCPLNEQCYPFGYRKEGKYCTDAGEFKKQLAGESSCENNFECKTNVCVDEKCIGSSLIKQMINFFKKLFG